MAYSIKVDTRLCKGCGICVSICPRKALSLSKDLSRHGYRYPIADELRCTGCRLCEVFCPDFAISVVKQENKER